MVYTVIGYHESTGEIFAHHVDYPGERVVDATQETAMEWARMIGQLCKSNGEVMTHAFL